MRPCVRSPVYEAWRGQRGRCRPGSVRCTLRGMADDNPRSGPRHAWLHWGALTAMVYVVLLVLLTMPVLLTAFPAERAKGRIPWEIFAAPPYWMFVLWVGLSQFLLIRVPVRLKLGRPVTRRGLWLPIVATGFWMGCLMMGGVFSVLEWRNPNLEPEQNRMLWLGLPLLTWAVWAIVFGRLSLASDVRTFSEVQNRWMLRGSILELLVAVPTHVVTRGRAECCAGFLTFFGITMGLSVMLLAFGPAVFFLFYSRWKRLGGGGG